MQFNRNSRKTERSVEEIDFVNAYLVKKSGERGLKLSGIAIDPEKNQWLLDLVQEKISNGDNTFTVTFELSLAKDRAANKDAINAEDY